MAGILSSSAGRPGAGGDWEQVMRSLDIPPVWLALALGVSWALSLLGSVLTFAGIGKILIALALLLMLAALAQMLLARTTFIPRRDPQALVVTGVFALSRNPIYLADAVLLTGLFLYWGALVALPLVAVFMQVLTRRFIVPEEARLRQKFGADFNAYKNRTRRWI